MTPLVSIIMPLYNAERFVAQSIESVLAQSHTHWELLIADDHSSDGSVGIVKGFAERDTRIHLFEMPQNQGASKCRDFLMQQANGRFIAFLDSDDLWLPKKLEKQMAFMLDNNYAFTDTQYETIAENGAPKNVVKTAGAVDYKKYLRNTIIGCCTAMLDRRKLQALPILGETRGDDMAMWLNILKQVEFAAPLDETLSQYRDREGSLSSNKIKAMQDVWHVYRHNEGLNIFQALFCFVGYAFNAVQKSLF